MSQAKGSCLKRMVFGCGCLSITSALVLCVGAAVFYVSHPEEPLFTVVDHEDSLTSEHGPFLPANHHTDKPIRLILRITDANLTLIPDGSPGHIRFSGEYDQANYRFNTRTSVHEDLVEYTVILEKQRTLGSWVLSEDSEKINTLVMHIPRNLPLELALDLNKGSGDIDLTGIPVKALDAEFTLGNFTVRKSAPNVIDADSVMIENKLSSLMMADIQNFRFKKADIDTTMSEARIYSTGPFEKNAELNLDLTMGQLYFQVPDETRIDADLNCKIGNYCGPTTRSTNQTSNILRIRGDCKLGGIEVVSGKYKKLFTDVMYETFLLKGIDAAINRYETELKMDKREYRWDDHALRTLGYKLLDIGYPTDALRIFELNAREYPDHHKSYRAIAAAQKSLGMHQAAISNLEKALTIHPEYSSARRMLRDLHRIDEARSNSLTL